MHALSEKTPPTRFLLDTNIWRYIIDHEKENSLVHLASSQNLLIQISPATVNETLRLGDIRLMKKIVRLQTKPCFTRLLPEVVLNSRDIINEIQRLHPEWIRKEPDNLVLRKWLNFWNFKWWERVRKSPSAEAKHLRQVEKGLVSRLRNQAVQKRNSVKNSSLRHNNLPMDKWQVLVPRPLPGWERNLSVEAWRLEVLTSLTNSILSFQNGMYPLLEAIVDLSDGLLTSRKWDFFWLYEVERSNLAGVWLEWSHEFSSAFRKTTPGTPGDTQLFNYLSQTDVLVTADKGILSILEEVRPYSPVPLPKPFKVTASKEGVELLLNHLSKVSISGN